MMSKLFLALIGLAVVSIALTIGYITSHQQAAELHAPYREPPSSPTAQRVAGAGVVEASSQNIDIGVSTSGVVTEVAAKPGQQVKRGDVLLKLDSRDAEATVAFQLAAVEVARQQLDELKQLPRPEDVLIADAKVRAAQALVDQQQKRLARARKLIGQNAMSSEELDAILEAESVAREELASAEAEQTKLKAGAWAPQLATAEAQLKQASAALQQSKTAVELRTVTTPIDAEVLQVDVQVGEYVSGAATKSLIVLGETNQLNVRVDIDEVDIPRFEKAKTATAFRRGDSQTPIALTLLRIEPLVIPKQTLTGENRERTDTRVLQAIFSVNANSNHPNLYVGQQLDVFAATE